MKKIIKLITITMTIMLLASCGSTPVDDSSNTVAPNIDVSVKDDYDRSVKELKGETVTVDQFSKDKAEILKKIDELQDIINNKDFNKWTKYIAPESLEFYSVPRKISTGRGAFVNNGLTDYFQNIFIPTRKSTKVQGIRYESSTNIKVVDSKEKVFYNFVKLNGKWLLRLPRSFVIDD